MEKLDYYDYSPVRIFDKCTDGGLKTGEIGLVTSKKGLGKTSVLVQFGMDELAQGKHLVHVSFDQHSSNVISWYESIFNEASKRKNVANASELKDKMVRNRTILNFNQENFSLPKVINTLKALNEGGITVSALVIDGVDLSKVTVDDITAVADFTKKHNLMAWFSATAEGGALNDSVPADLEKYFAGVIHLSPRQDGVYVSILKFHGMPAIQDALRLDAKTLLLTEK
ncbi:hypothetical protein HRI96_02930 [Treponema parvum]|uniref:KaiC-like domain-containing protein n=1 Tax=Treponema parvum TaxID=138851 RepID=A0A975EYI4_9SPIR|nr:ATPase domain-containing protein [Treponema parvum]QTQ11239.1 hypothetical protein HRI96_02930 [Treponema parvum]